MIAHILIHELRLYRNESILINFLNTYIHAFSLFKHWFDLVSTYNLTLQT